MIPINTRAYHSLLPHTPHPPPPRAAALRESALAYQQLDVTSTTMVYGQSITYVDPQGRKNDSKGWLRRRRNQTSSSTRREPLPSSAHSVTLEASNGEKIGLGDDAKSLLEGRQRSKRLCN